MGRVREVVRWAARMPDVPSEREFNLAIETSSRRGSVTVGRGDRILRSVFLPEQQGHRVDLVPMMAQVCGEVGIKVSQIGQVYVSAGPGSFTGLRIGITTAKVLGWVTGAKLVAVPTVDVVAWNVREWAGEKEGAVLAVCLNSKRGSVYGRLYGWRDGRWEGLEEAGLWAMQELVDRARRMGGGKVLVVGEVLPEFERGEGVEVLPRELAEPRSEGVWETGRRLAEEGRYVGPEELKPIYARRPEAVELWEERRKRGQVGNSRGGREGEGCGEAQG